MKKKFAKYLVPKKVRILFSENILLNLERESVWETDDTDGLPHAFTAVYKLVSIKKAKKK